MSLLGELLVKFKLSGEAEVAEATKRVQKNLTDIKAGVDVVAAAALRSFGAASAAVGGFVTAGVAASNMGAVMGFQMERLSRTIAGLFRPEIARVIDLVYRLSNWIDRLTPAQKRMAAAMIEGGVVVAAVSAAIPLLVAGVQSLTAAMVALNVASGEVLPIVGAVAAALISLGAGAAVTGFSLGGLWDAVQPLIDGLKKAAEVVWQALQPAFESLGDVFDAALDVLADLSDLFGVLAQAAGEELAAALEIIVPVFQIVAELMRKVLETLDPLIKGMVMFARIVLSVVAPALKALADAARDWLKGVALSMGIDLDDHRHRHAGGNQGPLQQRAGGFEDVEQTYRRIAQASLLAGGPKSVAQQQLDEAKAHTAVSRGIKAGIDNLKPAVK